MPFRGDFSAFPHSMEWGYIPWGQLQQGEWMPSPKTLRAVLQIRRSRHPVTSEDGPASLVREHLLQSTQDVGQCLS